MQAGSVICGATGVWVAIGNGWQALTLSHSLKRMVAEGVAVSEASLISGALCLPLRLGFIGHEGTCQDVPTYQQLRAGMHETVTQGLKFFSDAACAAMMQLATEVADELHDSYPEELNRTSLRDIRFKRPDPRARWRIKSLAVRKFAHLTPMERYERAQAHARMLPSTLKMLDFMLLEHLALLHQSAHMVRYAIVTTSSLDKVQHRAMNDLSVTCRCA